jgi:putative ABC transport system permease protein
VTAMSSLDRKLLRDFRRIWAQALAIALVIAGGVASLVMAVGSSRSLDETRIAYYERNRFADAFATVTRAPKLVIREIERIPGVATVEGRITKFALVDIPGVTQPATAVFVSLPDSGQPDLNRLHIRTGRLPDPASRDEVVLNASFAEAQGLAIGSRFSALLNGRKRNLVVVGTVLSPEFLYAIGPGDIMPDDTRFGIAWMPERALAAAYDLEGAFSSVAVKLAAGASEVDVLSRMDVILDRYGGRAAYGRKDQTSNAFLDHELDMLENMSRTLPPIFVLVSAFLVNLILGRLIALEREQIGLLKALGFHNWAIAAHYLKLVGLIALAGIAIGAAAGILLGQYVTELFANFFRFPFLIFAPTVDLYLGAGAIGAGAAMAGAAAAVRGAVALEPAVAMRPPAPPAYRRLLPDWLDLGRSFGQRSVMGLRSMAHHPLRALLTAIGLAFATGMLVVSLFTRDTMDLLVDVTYFLADRQDATLSFAERRPERAVGEVLRLPGVLAAEPYREVPVRIRFGAVERRLMVTGRPAGADLSRIIDLDLSPVTPPSEGLAVSGMLASILGARVGDLVELDLLEGQRRTVTVPVAALVEDYFGLKGMMDDRALARLLREAPAVSGVHVSMDETRQEELFAAVKTLPVISGLALQKASLANFRKTIALLVTTMGSIYTTLAAIIAFGIVYNSARIALSERARELASLKVLGFRRGEVLRLLLGELALLALVAQPPGWAIGYGLASLMRNNLAGELMRVRLVVENTTYVLASAVVLAAALASAMMVVRRVDRLDLVAVLKTRD